jgi:hypothetical protein
MLVSPDGRLMLVSALHSEKAEELILVTVAGISMLVSALHS